MYDLKPTPEALAEVEEAIRRNRLLNLEKPHLPQQEDPEGDE